MKIKKKAAALLCLCLCAVLMMSGCSLAKEDGQGQTTDRLIGVLITPEWLDVSDTDEALQNSGLQDGTVKDDSGEERLYAEMTEQTTTDEETGETWTEKKYQFSDTTGLLCIAPRVTTEDGESCMISSADDAVEYSVNLLRTDDGDEMNLDVTVYLTASADPDEIREVYVNPVYQADDDSVYAVSGQGFSFSASVNDGSELSQTISGETEITVDGKRQQERANITVHLGVMAQPEQITVRQMDGQSQCLSETVYEPGTLPETLTVQEKTAYVLVETAADENGDATVSREIYEAQDDVLYTYYAREDGFCVRTETQLLWPGAEEN